MVVREMSLCPHGETFQLAILTSAAKSNCSTRRTRRMRVTFDTNVWNRMVFPELHIDEPNYQALVELKNAVRDGRIRGFISEAFATIEAIKRENRAKFHVQNTPKVRVTDESVGNGLIRLTIQIEANHDQHPGIGEEFEGELKEALAIGIKLLSSPYIAVTVPNELRKRPEIYAEGVFETQDYNDRFGEAITTIVGRGVGNGVLVDMVKEFTERLDGPRPKTLHDRALIYGVYELARQDGDKKQMRRIEDSYGESADGDVVAAHIAYGNEYLCTDDRAKSASSPSIFNVDNRAWLRSKYGVKIVTSQELAELVTTASRSDPA